eukprot:gene17345-biopygen21870
MPAPCPRHARATVLFPLGEQEGGAGMARAWRGLLATIGHEWRGRGAGVARAFPVSPGLRSPVRGVRCRQVQTSPFGRARQDATMRGRVGAQTQPAGTFRDWLAPPDPTGVPGIPGPPGVGAHEGLDIGIQSFQRGAGPYPDRHMSTHWPAPAEPRSRGGLRGSSGARFRQR